MARAHDRAKSTSVSAAGPFFARTQANRVWLHLLGRGLVDPNDDFRATNPPSNPDLLDHLTAEFKANGFRLKPLVRRVLDPDGKVPYWNEHADGAHFPAMEVPDLLVDDIRGFFRAHG